MTGVMMLKNQHGNHRNKLHLKIFSNSVKNICIQIYNVFAVLWIKHAGFGEQKNLKTLKILLTKKICKVVYMLFVEHHILYIRHIA